MRYVLIAATLLASTLGHVEPALAAQMPKEFHEDEEVHGEWRSWEAPDLRSEDQTYFICTPGPNCPEALPQEIFRVTADGVETADTRCTAIRVTKFNACPWGRLSKRPSQFNPYGPIYNIKLQCKGKNGKAFSLVHDWVFERTNLRLMRAPGYRCIYPRPTKPDLPR